MGDTAIDRQNYPAYGFSEASAYLRLPYQTLRGWTSGEGLIAPPSHGRLSYNNLLELHILKALRKAYRLPMQRIRLALKHLFEIAPGPHPLLDPRFRTDGIDLFLHEGEEYLNLSRQGQFAFNGIVAAYMQRIRDTETSSRFYPFIVTDTKDEPMHVLISPTVAFGRPVIANTGISTEVIAGRFLARDSVEDLAREYQVSQNLIEEAVRWELPHLNAAA